MSPKGPWEHARGLEPCIGSNRRKEKTGREDEGQAAGGWGHDASACLYFLFSAHCLPFVDLTNYWSLGSAIARCLMQ